MKYYIIVASKDHVTTGKENGFAQAGHGKKTQLNKLKKNDWIIYYSSKDNYKERKVYQKFTAIGQVIDNEPYQVTVNPDFKPWRMMKGMMKKKMSKTADEVIEEFKYYVENGTPHPRVEKANKKK